MTGGPISQISLVNSCEIAPFLVGAEEKLAFRFGKTCCRRRPGPWIGKGGRRSTRCKSTLSRNPVTALRRTAAGQEDNLTHSIERIFIDVTTVCAVIVAQTVINLNALIDCLQSLEFSEQ